MIWWLFAIPLILLGCPFPKKVGDWIIDKNYNCIIKGPIAINGNVIIKGNLTIEPSGGLYLIDQGKIIIGRGANILIQGIIGTASCKNECDFNTTKCENKTIYLCTTTGDSDPCTEWVKIKEVECCSDSDCPSGYYCENHICKEKVTCRKYICCRGKDIYEIITCSDGRYSKTPIDSCGVFRCGSFQGDGWYKVSALPDSCLLNIYGCERAYNHYCNIYDYIKIERRCCAGSIGYISCTDTCGSPLCLDVLVGHCNDATIWDVEKEAIRRIGNPSCYSVKYNPSENYLIIKVYNSTTGYCDITIIKCYKVIYSFGNTDNDPCTEIKDLSVYEISC